ncbi:BA75_03453T0 [Komagataella pastoris]|uniref:BA75_03453T0 n=1 Tax=Komagataella pastoris TaxID=4922 RepID=A0A1B2JF38_PICPA|nr:BA75_03453T0 [Komagataella pastoris]
MKRHSQVAHARVICDTVSSGENIIWKKLKTHHFVNNLRLVLPASDYLKIQAQTERLTFTYYEGTIALHKLITAQFIDKIKDDPQFLLLTHSKEIDDDNVICITDGSLYLSLTEETYRRSGLLGKQSGFMLPRKQKCKWNLKIDISKGLNFERTENQQFKLLWFLEKVLIEEFQVVMSFNQEQLDIPGFEKCQVAPHVSIFKNSLVPDLQFQQDDSWLCEILEWIALCTLKSKQLVTSEDPYISAYSETVSIFDNEDRNSRLDLVIVEWMGLLLPKHALFSTIKSLQLQDEVYRPSWFAMVDYGVMDSNLSHGNNEHSFESNGEHIDLVLGKHEEWLLYQVLGARDGS